MPEAVIILIGKLKNNVFLHPEIGSVAQLDRATAF
jgi:hypothetical protein